MPPRTGGGSCRRANTRPRDPTSMSDSRAFVRSNALSAVCKRTTPWSVNVLSGPVSVRPRTDAGESTVDTAVEPRKRSSSQAGWLTEAGPDASPPLRLASQPSQTQAPFQHPGTTIARAPERVRLKLSDRPRLRQIERRSRKIRTVRERTHNMSACVPTGSGVWSVGRPTTACILVRVRV